LLSTFIFPLARPKFVRPAGTITVPAPFHVGRSFIDYMTIDGHRLYAGYTSAGLVGVIDTTTSQPAGAVDGLGHTHGIAVVPVATSDSRAKAEITPSGYST